MANPNDICKCGRRTQVAYGSCEYCSRDMFWETIPVDVYIAQELGMDEPESHDE